MSFNKVTIVGNLGRDPEVRYTAQGTAVCEFSIATNERRKNGDSYQDITTWFIVTVWGRQAESASQYLRKGRIVYIEGNMRVEEWKDRENKDRYTLRVDATDLKYIDRAQHDVEEAAA
jgi:single-strand DNA-binding protein